MRGVPKWVAGTNANVATWAFGGPPYGATNRVRGVPKWVAGTNANAATWAFGGAPYKERRGEETRRGWGEEKRRGEKKREEERRGEEEGEEQKREEEEETRGAVSSKRGPNTTGWLGKISLAKDPTICSCESRSCEYRLRRSSLWGHETCEGCAEMSGGDACELCHWGLRRSSYGATKRVRGVPK